MSDIVMPSGFRRTDLVRLMTQCLTTLGYSQAAQLLEQESGILLLSEPIERFRAAVLAGDWALAESLIASLGFPTAASRLSAELLVLRQKYLELLEARKAEDALRCLRNQLAPLEQRMAAEGCLPTAASSGVTNGSSHPSIHAASIAGSSARSSPAPTDGMLPPPGSNNSSVSNGKAASSSPNARLGISVRELSAYLMCTNEELMRRTGWDGSQGKPSSSSTRLQPSSTSPTTTPLTPLPLPSFLSPRHLTEYLTIRAAAIHTACVTTA